VKALTVHGQYCRCLLYAIHISHSSFLLTDILCSNHTVIIKVGYAIDFPLFTSKNLCYGMDLQLLGCGGIFCIHQWNCGFHKMMVVNFLTSCLTF
jgi:hypothetical protein